MKNVFIRYKRGQLEEQNVDLEEPQNIAIIIRILFTLTTTDSELGYFSELVCCHSKSNHYGYTSIGIIERIYEPIGGYYEGSLLLLPAYFDKYIFLKKEEFNRIREKLCIKVSSQNDLIRMLFLPMICLSFKMFNDSMEDNKSIIFNSSHLVGLFLAQLFSATKHDINIILNERDIKKVILLHYAKSIINNNSKVKVQKKLVIDLSTGSECKTDSMNFDMQYGNNKKKIWQNKMIIDSVLQSPYFGYLDYEVLDIVHVHSESLEYVNKIINNKSIESNFLIYDW